MSRPVFQTRPFGAALAVRPGIKWISRLHLRMFGTTFLARRISAMHVMPEISSAGFTSALDAGCSDGIFALTLALQHPQSRIAGVDIDPARIKTAAEFKSWLGADNVEFYAGDLRRLEMFGPGSFDLVYTVNVLEHIADAAAALAEFYRILRPGGRIVAYTPAPAARRVLPGMRSLKDDEMHPDHVREGFTIEELSAELERAGFSVVSRRYALGFWGELAWELAFFVEKNPYLHGLAYPFLLLLAQGERFGMSRGNAVMVHARK